MELCINMTYDLSTNTSNNLQSYAQLCTNLISKYHPNHPLHSSQDLLYWNRFIQCLGQRLGTVPLYPTANTCHRMYTPLPWLPMVGMVCALHMRGQFLIF